MTILSSTYLATKHGRFHATLHDYNGQSAVALTFGEVRHGIPLLRIHSSCLFSEALGANDCDCALQLSGALDLIASSGSGVVVYLYDEGRGHGLRLKMRAMAIQDECNLDTVEAFDKLGLIPDVRDFAIAVDTLQELRISKRVRLISNNPCKRRALQEAGFQVSELVRLRFDITPEIEAYLKTKEEKLGHLLHWPSLISVSVDKESISIDKSS